ncbi:MAG: hypothetical protein GWQ05_28785 [Verrucomicrobiaceae bacterium]|nr:hypothetical protein [Verrucomicrobiaceae bacterium]
MARPSLTNRLQLKPRAPRSKDGASALQVDAYNDFEPRLQFYMDEVRRNWPGGAPVSWKDAIRLRQWSGAYPGIHWAAVECLLELGRASRGGAREIVLAWQTLALGAVHVIVDGGGLPQGLSSAALAGLLKRAEECLPAFGTVHKVGFVSVDEIARALERHAQHPGVRGDELRAGFVKSLNDMLEFRERLHAPAGTDLVSALHYILIEHPKVFSLALQLPSPRPQEATFESAPSVVPANESDALLESLLKVEDQMGLADGQVTPPASDSRRPRRLEAPVERSVSEVAARSSSKFSLSSGFRKPMPRASSSGSRRPSYAKTERAWSETESDVLSLSNKLQWISVLLGGSCLLVVFVVMTGHWTINARGAGEEAQVRLRGLPNPLDTVDAFANASTIEEKIALLQDPADADAARKHFANAWDHEFEVDYVQSLGHGRSGGHSFHASRIRFRDGSSRLIAIHTDPETGRLSIDWHAYARTASMHWNALMQGDGDGALVRAFVRRADYYNFAFEDVHRFACYQIISPDTEEALYGYVERRTPRHALMEDLLAQGLRQRMALRIGAPTTESEPIQYWIDEIVANDWVLDPSGSLEHSAFASDVGSSGDFSSGPAYVP